MDDLREYLSTKNELPPVNSEENANFTGKLYRLSIEAQLSILREFAHRTNSGRTWKIVGYLYYWTGDNAFLSDAIKALEYSLSAGFPGPKDTAYETMAACYLFMNNYDDAMKWLSKSERIDIQYVVNEYGSLENYFNIGRFANAGDRYHGVFSRFVTKNSLHLGREEKYVTHNLSHYKIGCNNPEVNQHLFAIITRILDELGYSPFVCGAERLNEIDLICASPINFSEVTKDPQYNSGRIYYCYMFMEIDGCDYLVNDKTKEWDKELTKLGPLLFSGKDNLKAGRIRQNYIEDCQFEYYLSRLLNATVYTLGSLTQNEKNYRKFAWTAHT